MLEEVVDGFGLVVGDSGFAPLPGHARHPAQDRDNTKRAQCGWQGVAPAPHPGSDRRADRSGLDRFSAEPALQVIGQGSALG